MVTSIIRGDTIQKKEYIIFFITGVLALIVGFACSEFLALEGLEIGGFLLLVWILFNTALYLSLRKRRTVKASMIALSLFAFVLSFNALLAYFAYEHYQAKAIQVEKIQPKNNLTLEKHPVCISVTEQQLVNYPSLKKALKSANKSGSAVLDTPPEEWGEIMSFVGCHGCIEYNGSYFEVSFMTA